MIGTLGCSGDMNRGRQIEFVLMYSFEGTAHYVSNLEGFPGFFTARRQNTLYNSDARFCILVKFIQTMLMFQYTLV